MTLLTPLGLLGLLSLAVLILIYILRPNFQQRFISSTYIWKLSLKYRKRRLPTSKLRNILIIICQVLILTLCSAILAQPNKVLKKPVTQSEVICVIDSSASMRAQTNDESRFDRAVAKVKQLSSTVWEGDGIVSVILADDTPEYMGTRVNAEDRASLEESLDTLKAKNQCAYGVSDLDSAMTLCQEVLLDNPKAVVHLFTDTEFYSAPEGVEIVSVRGEGEWNAAILGATATLDDGYYTVSIDIASYGDANRQLGVDLEVLGANAEGEDDLGQEFAYSSSVVDCDYGVVKTIIFSVSESSLEDENVSYEYLDPIYSFNRINISLYDPNGGKGEALGDSFAMDNTFEIYNGNKEVLKVQYASPKSNSYFNVILFALQSEYSDRFDIIITEVTDGEFATEGYDFYIFEHEMPSVMPSDGIVFLSDLDAAPSGSDIRFNGNRSYRDTMELTEEASHPITKGVTANKITVTKVNVLDPAEGYEVLMTCDGDPVLMVKNEGSEKVIVLGFSLNFSNFSLLLDFPRMLNNTMKYFLPATVQKDAFEVGEDVAVNSRSPELLVSGYQTDITISEFPSKFTVFTPGTYTLTQTTYYGEEIVESIYVKIPASESNIRYTAETLTDPYLIRNDEAFLGDLLLYLAAALVAIVFIERLLQSLENS